MSVAAYHPETRADLVVTEEQLAHMRAAGWILKSEYDAQQAAIDASLQAAAAAAQPSKPSKSDGK